MREQQLNSWRWTMVLVLSMVPFALSLRGQEVIQQPPGTNMLAEAELLETPPSAENAGKHYNIRWGTGGLNLSAGLQLRYVDNVFLSNTGRRDDFVVQPEAEVAAFFPIGRSNSFVLDVDITYYEYTKNTSLNTGIPIINPNSELAFNIQTGDFLFRPSEAFSYQENPVYETGGEFFNVENTGRLARYENRAGLGAKWDLTDLVFDAGYYHENLWANGSEFNYINHVSELLNADAMFAVSPILTAGVESWGSVNRFDNQTIRNSWRVLAGPGVRWKPTQFVNVQFGGGYERIEYTSSAASDAGIEGQNSFYAYARVEHQFNKFIRHALEGSHDNQLGYNAGNLEGYHVTYTLTWQPKEQLTITPLASVNFYREAFGTSVPGLYDERFTYVLGGATAAYQFGEHWRASVSWAYRLKDSGTSGLGYSQNQAAIELLYAF